MVNVPSVQLKLCALPNLCVFMHQPTFEQLVALLQFNIYLHKARGVSSDFQ